MSSHADVKHMAMDEYTRAESAAMVIRMQLSQKPQLGAPEIAVVLGSGLGALAEELKDSVVIPYADIPNFPRATAVGHEGRLVVGKSGSVTVAAMQGRVHQYEGYSSREAAFPVRVLGRLGVKSLVLTSAAGGINPAYRQGALVVLSDHINLQGNNPLNGPNDERFGPRFPDMSEAYSRSYRRIALDAGRELGIELQEGVYAALRGPSYETPAEIRYLRAIGADLVGMSTVPEVIVARHMGIAVLGISCVTNLAAGMSESAIDHEEVLAAGKRVSATLLALLTAIVPRIVAENK
ncbi:MAG: purine-nucleoside phosphorylase [Candidatus Korobacteraceae bacterium]